MIPVDGSYLYSLGQAVQSLNDVKKDDSNFDAMTKLFSAVKFLREFLNNSVYTSVIQFVVEPAEKIIEVCNKIRVETIEKGVN